MFIFIVIIDVSLVVDLSSVELFSLKYNNNNELKLDFIQECEIGYKEDLFNYLSIQNGHKEDQKLT